MNMRKVTDVFMNTRNVTGVFMRNTTDVFMDMRKVPDIFMGRRNVTDLFMERNMTDVFTDMRNTTDVLTYWSNMTDGPMTVGKQNMTDEFLEMDNVRDVMNHMTEMMSIVLIYIGVAIIITNSFVISIFMVHTWMRSNANIIICSMAITDLLGGLVTIAVGIVKWTDWFQVHSLMCRLLDTTDSWIAMASLAHVLAVNAERYLAIVFPLKYKYITSASRIRLILYGIWIVTLVEAVVYAVFIKLNDRCARTGIAYPGLAFSNVVLGMALPVLIVVVIYIHIVVVIVKKLRFMAKSSNLDNASLSQSQRKMMGTVSAILAAWIICWGPLVSILLIRTFAMLLDIGLDMRQYFIMLFFFEPLKYLNSLCNPILYFITSHDFRKAGNKLCKCKGALTSGTTNTDASGSTDTRPTRFT